MITLCSQSPLALGPIDSAVCAVLPGPPTVKLRGNLSQDQSRIVTSIEPVESSCSILISSDHAVDARRHYEVLI